MELNVIFNLATSRKSFERLDTCNGTPGIRAATENPVYRPNGKSVHEQIAHDHSDLVYEVSIGDYIYIQEYDYATGTTYITCYKIVDISDTEVICDPC